MKACRARPKAAAQIPRRNTDAASTPSDGANTIPIPATIAITPAITIVYLSPILPTAHPAGRFPHSCPMTSAEATSAANATSAPMDAASTGMSGMTAPSPSAKRIVGRYTMGPNWRRTVDALLTASRYSARPGVSDDGVPARAGGTLG